MQYSIGKNDENHTSGCSKASSIQSTAPELGRDRAVLRLQDKPESTGEKKKQLVDQKAKGGV